VLDWRVFGGSSKSGRPFSSVYSLSWWSQSATLILAAYLAPLHLDNLERKKSQVIQNSSYLNCWTRSKFILTGG
ncbi:hypothetical protein A2U01_0059804, partial [Trifolium medium]|nr:hypothetical protein [Trifolium medium]